MKNKNVFLIGCIVLFLAACSDRENAGGSTEVGNSVAIVDKTIAGTSQKGPLIKGSTVRVFELDENTLAQKGLSFTGQVIDNDGGFSVEHINLNSSYALLEASGPYYSELTGKISNNSIVLNAFADISQRENVNINLLTHLEYGRVLWLLHNEEQTVKMAKAVADSEIFAEFSKEKVDFQPEELNVLKEGEGNAVLLAASILMQLGQTESEFQLNLANFVDDMKIDGRWDDVNQKTMIADAAFDADLDSLRGNILAWGVSDSIPAFEKYVEEFWNRQFGLGTCNKVNDSTVALNDNTLSAYYGRSFTCLDGHWILNDGSKQVDYPEVRSSAIDKLDCSGSMYCPKNCQNVMDAAMGRNCSRVMTELDDGSDTYGFFAMGNDESSSFTWPAGDRGYGVEAASRDKYGFLYGIAKVGTGKDPYAYIGFDVSGIEMRGNDLTNWKGLCLAYSATEDFFIALTTPENSSIRTESRYVARVPAAAALSVADVAWDRFVNSSDGDGSARDSVVKNVSYIDIRFTNPDSKNSFKIHAIGKLGSCNKALE